jgi:hypothetical protein
MRRSSKIAGDAAQANPAAANKKADLMRRIAAIDIEHRLHCHSGRRLVVGQCDADRELLARFSPHALIPMATVARPMSIADPYCQRRRLNLTLPIPHRERRYSSTTFSNTMPTVISLRIWIKIS